ncbi:class I SAM-dependent methyltransferase [Neorhizobium petrolearium]|uniref:class I SAM-dependent methyltransferase n=1 Tax=Neorhizobium petrolearium TaxID=515361 RepID=UPI003F7DE1E0
MSVTRRLKKIFSKTKKSGEPKPEPLTAAQKLYNKINDVAMEEAAEFVRANIAQALIFEDIEKIMKYSLDTSAKNGLLLEFGVFRGKSINLLARHLKEAEDARPIYGFDAFLGLQEDWSGTDHRSFNQFNLQGVAPKVEDNVELVRGWIEDTLPTFLEKHRGDISYLHIDTDTYTPCKTILTLCKDRLKSGSVILFDDMLCYPGWKNGEFKALEETFSPGEYTWRAFCGWRAMLVIN